MTLLEFTENVGLSPASIFQPCGWKLHVDGRGVTPEGLCSARLSDTLPEGTDMLVRIGRHLFLVDNDGIDVYAQQLTIAGT